MTTNYYSIHFKPLIFLNGPGWFHTERGSTVVDNSIGNIRADTRLPGHYSNDNIGTVCGRKRVGKLKRQK